MPFVNGPRGAAKFVRKRVVVVESFAGKILVASSTASHPIYSGGVGLVVHQDDEQTLGVMLNRPLHPHPDALAALAGAMSGLDEEDRSEAETDFHSDEPVGDEPLGGEPLGGEFLGHDVSGEDFSGDNFSHDDPSGDETGELSEQDLSGLADEIAEANWADAGWQDSHWGDAGPHGDSDRDVNVPVGPKPRFEFPTGDASMHPNGDPDGPRGSEQNHDGVTGQPRGNPSLAELITGPLGQLHFGGPVSGPVVALHGDQQWAEMEMSRGIYVAADREHLQQLIQSHSHPFRLIVGHLRWAPGALESEIDQGLWHAIDATPARVFGPAGGMWPRLIRRATAASLASWMGTADLEHAGTWN